MTIVQIGDFGKNNNGVRTYSINATEKEDLYHLIVEVRKMGWKFWQTPNITKKFKTYHVTLEIYRR
jgi:hypothetical protein